MSESVALPGRWSFRVVRFCFPVASDGLGHKVELRSSNLLSTLKYATLKKGPTASIRSFGRRLRSARRKRLSGPHSASSLAYFGARMDARERDVFRQTRPKTRVAVHNRGILYRHIVDEFSKYLFINTLGIIKRDRPGEGDGEER